MDDSSVVSINELVKRYRLITALAGVSLDIHRGEVFGLIGPNGAGKTTLIRAIVGALQPTEGAVRVLGLDPLRDRWSLRSRLGYMPQQPALYPDLSVRRNVAFFGAAHRRGDLAGDVERALQLVGLAERAADPVRTLSGGMQQRLSMACALVHRPELVILDEPTAGVDPELRAAFWEEFRAMSARGTTVIVSTHQMNEAMACDRVALLRAGTVLAAEDPRVLFHSRRATVRLRRGSWEQEVVLDDYATELPHLVQHQVDSVEVEPEPIDDIVLRLIRRGEQT
jgi:ABC-2 type transport system ATP-binding protein